MDSVTKLKSDGGRDEPYLTTPPPPPYCLPRSLHTIYLASLAVSGSRVTRYRIPADHHHSVRG